VWHTAHRSIAVWRCAAGLTRNWGLAGDRRRGIASWLSAKSMKVTLLITGVAHRHPRLIAVRNLTRNCGPAGAPRRRGMASWLSAKRMKVTDRALPAAHHSVV
jgi:hypothetical protein